MSGPTSRRPFRPLTAVRDPVLDSTDEFEFVVSGEARPTLPQMPLPPKTVEILREVRLLRPAFVLYTGDSVWGYDAGRQEFLNDLDRFGSAADETGVPLFNAPGNHEMQSDPEAIRIVQERGQDLYGSFDVGDYHFIALNTDEFCKEGRVTDEQLEWLRADLAEHRDARAMFVFMHRPIFSWFQGDFNPDDAELLQGLFREHPVRAVFASHDHFFHREDHDGVAYMTVGGGGAPLYAQPPSGGFAHYVLVRVGPGGIDYNVVEPGHLRVDHTAGNDGIEPLTIVRISNTTDRDLTLRALPFRVPRLESSDRYELSVDYVDWARKRPEVSPRLRSVRDLGDGSVELSVEVDLPTGVAFRVRAEARL